MRNTDFRRMGYTKASEFRMKSKIYSPITPMKISKGFNFSKSFLERFPFINHEHKM